MRETATMTRTTQTTQFHSTVAFIGVSPILPCHSGNFALFRIQPRISPKRKIFPHTPRPQTPNCVALQNSNEATETGGTKIVSDIVNTNVPPPKFGLVAADIVILVLLCCGFVVPTSAMTQKSERVQRLFSAAIFTITSFLYILRVRSVKRKSYNQLMNANKNISRIDTFLDENEQHAEVALLQTREYQKELNHATLEQFQFMMDRNSRRQDAQHAELLRTMRVDVDELLASFEVLRDKVKSEKSADLKNAETEIREKQIEIVQLQTRLGDIQTNLNNAIARENALKVELDSLRLSANESITLRERLLSAQSRIATLEERLSRNQESTVSNQQQQQLPGGKALRDALLNLGKSFPPAGRLLFDPPQNSDDVRPPSSSIEQRPLKIQSNATLNWPDAALNASKSDLGLPKDGGFGTNHFAKKQDTNSDPFSALRGAFNNEDNVLPQGEVKVTEGKNRLEAAEQLGESMENEATESMEKLAFGSNENVATESTEESAVESTKDVMVGSTVSYLELLEKQESTAASVVNQDENTTQNGLLSNNTDEKIPEKVIESDESNEELQPAEVLKDSAMNDDVQASETPETTVQQTETMTKEVAGVEARIAKVREIVKRARRSDKVEAERLFASAVELLEATPVQCTSVDAELGGVLLAWARHDIAADGAKGRLQRAAKLLRTSSDSAEVTRFNLALCLCMLASLETSPRCEELYGEACDYYDMLEDRSRTVCFNAGLAYISRARIAGDPRLATTMYTSAKKQFEDALTVAPDDTKSRLYLNECEMRISELSSSS